MFVHPDLLAAMAKQHIDDLMKEASRNRLAAALHSNRRQRWRLYISPRTAAVHVSNILRKLGCSSRTEVAAALSR